MTLLLNVLVLPDGHQRGDGRAALHAAECIGRRAADLNARSYQQGATAFTGLSSEPIAPSASLAALRMLLSLSVIRLSSTVIEFKSAA